MSGYTRFAHGYYISNLLIIVSYYFIREYFLAKNDFSRSKFGGDFELVKMERQSLSLLGIALSLKFFRRQSLDGYFADVFFFCKSVIALLTWYMDYRWAIFYVFSYLGIAISFPQPFYTGKSKLTEFTPETLADAVENGSDSSVTWIIEFFAPWSPQCLVLEPVIANISNEYATDTLCFGKIDVSRWPSVGKRHKIHLTGISDQLPTLIRFEKGKETGRIPQISEDGKRVYGGKFRKHDILAAFGLK